MNSITHTFEIVDRKFIYDFELLSLEQCLTAETYFKLHEKMLKLLPANPADLEVAAQQMTQKYGFASILIELDSNGCPVPFNNLTFSTLPLQLIKGYDNRKKLEECKSDFFFKSGIAKNSSIESLPIIMNVIKELPEEIRLVLYKQLMKLVGSQIGLLANLSSIH